MPEQPPAPALLGELAPRAVVQGAEDATVLGAQVQEPFEQAPGRAAVGDDDGDRTPRAGRPARPAPARRPRPGSSPPRPRTGRPAIQSAYCSGYRSATSSRVSPSQQPMPCSRSRASSAERHAEEVGEGRGGLAPSGRGRWRRRRRPPVGSPAATSRAADGRLPACPSRRGAGRAGPGSGRRRSTRSGRAATAPAAAPRAGQGRAGHRPVVSSPPAAAVSGSPGSAAGTERRCCR